MSGGFKPSEGDWPCPDPSCGNVNFARRTSCNRCHADKPLDKKIQKGGIKIGTSAAEKSKGLFSADDWQCSKCGNVNWARRSTCNVCNGPQFTVEEERTGLGGGFNERGNVEYKERQESDEEFDDRGRKKKKGPRDAKPILPSMMVEESPDEEEEEEDEDDDGADLSKYDLWGDVDDKKDDSKDEKNGKEDVRGGDAVKRKKSRSGSRNHRRSRSKDKKRSRRSRSSSSSSSSSSSRSRSRSGKKGQGRNGDKSRRRSSSSSSSSRSR